MATFRDTHTCVPLVKIDDFTQNVALLFGSCLCRRKIQGIFCKLASMEKPDDILCGDDVVLDRPPSDLYITYNVYWGTIREVVKMIDFKEGNGPREIVPRSSLKSRDDEGTIR